MNSHGMPCSLSIACLVCSINSSLAATVISDIFASILPCSLSLYECHYIVCHLIAGMIGFQDFFIILLPSFLEKLFQFVKGSVMLDCA